MGKAKLILAAAFISGLLTGRLQAQDGPQLYNMGFDEWSKTKGVWYPYAADASPSQRIWDSGKFIRMVEMKGAESLLGAPFTARPKRLRQRTLCR